MRTFEIYWDDLTPEAQERLSELHNGNDNIFPLAEIVVEEDEEEIN